jgi:hypothetical protein
MDGIQKRRRGMMIMKDAPDERSKRFLERTSGRTGFTQI